MPGEVTIPEALDQIESRTATERNHGFANLKHILRKTPDLHKLKDKDSSVHEIYDRLFRIAIADRDAYLKASSFTTRTAADNRLTACTGALRTAVEETSRFIRGKTLRALIDHLTQLLRGPKGALCEPLALDYAKCLTALLTYQPHIEHMRREQRETCVRFCLGNIESPGTRSDDDDAEPAAEPPSTNGTSHKPSYLSSRSHYRESSGSQGGRSVASQVAEEMISCLALLTAAPNAVMGSLYEAIVRGAIGFLRAGTTNMKPQQDAFSVINHSLAWITTQDLALTQRSLNDIVRLIRLYWSPKTAADTLRDELLITLIHLRPHIAAAMESRENVILRAELRSALEVLRNEYGSRMQRSQLQIEDLRLMSSAITSNQAASIHNGICVLRCAGPRAEANWMAIDTLASLSGLLSQMSSDESPSDDEDEGGAPRPRKRQRLTSEFDELLEASCSGKVLARLTALQTLTLLAQQQPYSSRYMAGILERLSVSGADDNVDISSWALLALASFALQETSKHDALAKRWPSIWQLAARAMTNASTCRSACHLLYTMMRLRLVSFQTIAEFVQTMTISMDLNGPPLVADSVAQLLTFTVHISQQTNPTNSSGTAESVLGWLFRTFTPSQFANRDYAVHQLIFEAADVIDLIASCLGKPLLPPHRSAAQSPCWSRVGQAWLRSNAQSELTAYLLQLPSASEQSPHATAPSANVTAASSVPGRAGCEAIVLNNLSSEAFRLHEAWKQTALKDMSSEMFSLFCKSCHILASIVACATFRDIRRRDQLQKQVDKLLQGLTYFAKSSRCPQDKVDAMLTTFSHAFASLHGSGQCTEPCACELMLCQCTCDVMVGRIGLMESSGQLQDDELMDLDDEFDSQASRRTDRVSELEALPNDYAVAFGNLALRADAMIYAILRTKRSVAALEAGSNGSAAAQLLDTVFCLPDHMIIAGRNVMSGLPQLGLELTAEDGSRLTEFCGRIIEHYEYERCEVALGTVLDIMASISSIWTDPANKHSYEDGLDLYRWYIQMGLPHGILSSNVQCRLASLLLKLCHVDLDFGSDAGCPSPRTSLFELISKGNIAVQYHLAGRISTIFGLFVLSNHSIMFDDLRDTLPKDTTKIEGMAIRLLFFSRLASAWHSLLRECVYYIVETAGESRQAVKFATHCISELAKALRFDNPQKLFRLFAPQLLHSFLDGRSVNSLPFAIFQYDSLADLVTQNLAQTTAQLLVRGNDDGLDVIATTVNMSKVELLKRCLAKTEAYCISTDIITSSSSDAESRLRQAVGGKDQLSKLLVAQYPAIIAQFFLSAQNEDVEEKWLKKTADQSEAAKALAEMKGYSYSDKELPGCQQPSYKSKWLYHQIDRLCRRVGRADPAHRWDPSTFAYAARALVDSIDPALGPLHTCLVIRRLRLLVCLAGDVAVVNYQLEMLISALRPYLNDSQCADDAMGVLQYLFRHGQPYLSTQLQFIRGTITLMLLQIRKHSETRQESTTQESQHHATIGKMREFHGWLVEYLRSCQPKDASQVKNHIAFVRSLAQVQLPGNASRSTPESKLLLSLIEHGGSCQADKAIFRRVHRNEALLLLSENFEPPASVDDDCLSDDADCIRMAQQLWFTSQLSGLGSALLSWASGALGRAYAASGHRPVSRERDNALAAFDGVSKSQAAIAKRLSDCLYGATKSEASMADTTLRKILLSFRDADEAVVFENMLPTALVPALQPATNLQATVLNPTLPPVDSVTLQQLREPSPRMVLGKWSQSYSIALCLSAKKISVVPALLPALRAQPALSLDLFPMIVHILLAAELDRGGTLRTELSACVSAHLSDPDPDLLPKQSYLVKLLLYLRAQKLPGEQTQADRLRWLEVDWVQAAEAASRCNMPEIALLFAESATTPASSGGNRRASSRMSMSQVTMAQVPQGLLLSIFKSVDEPDSFYGVEQPPSLDSVLGRLDYEADGFRSLMFRSARTDTHILGSNSISLDDSAGMVRSLSMLNLNSLTFALLSSGGVHTQTSSNELLNAARKLQQWDIAAPELATGAPASCFNVFQELSRATSQGGMREELQSILLSHVGKAEPDVVPSREWFAALASMVEVEEVLGSSSQPAIRARWKRMQNRRGWMHLARFEDMGMISTNRQILFSTLARNESLLRDVHGAAKDFRSIEVEALLNVASLAGKHGKLQEALAAVRQAGDLVPVCEDFGLHVDAAVKLATASVLWDSNEATASVKMMQETLSMCSVDKQDIEGPGKAGLLARLAHQLGEARLEKADNILTAYLEPAIKQLGGRSDGLEAGEVFHEYATYCDKQLQNPGNIEDFERIARLRQKKLDEIQEFERLGRAVKRREQRDEYASEIRKAQKWLNIDDAEYQRLKKTRDTFTQQSLQNYMLTLRATNKYNIAVLRLFALWLENADVPEANQVASKYLSDIPSWKFVLLMNQLMSRLEQDGSPFQEALSALLLRICSDHPLHSLHHLFAATRKPGNNEPAAASRQRAAMTVRQRLCSNPKNGELLNRVFNANRMYDALANEDGKSLPNKASIKDLHSTSQMIAKIPGMNVPPITFSVELRANGDYSDVPVITRFSQTVRLMSGISRPKAITVYASDGNTYAQLFKSGNDDMRQDAIMEQVFEEVSKMLRNHKASRQRNLVVRTYKVIPLSATAGAIEFVPNSMSFADFLKPAHQRYYPQDYKDGKAREMIAAVAQHSTETRVKEFRKVCEHMHPVMRHFFFERFTDPDEWFQKRTAYTRTTASISILGYVVGLGDRHCQNIMLDEKSGEVVHIDLGVAFEAGRVLPIPELVPFRLSRDVVDGMGITKTEGVFRRCCEFTMDALREDKDSIMTLLNVLRYDPLYTWSVSPLKAKRMQEETGREQGGTSKKKDSEVGEADRALSIVEKKLSKTLSTAATVNELIQQATDEKHLATLFHGWSAWN